MGNRRRHRRRLTGGPHESVESGRASCPPCWATEQVSGQGDGSLYPRQSVCEDRAMSVTEGASSRIPGASVVWTCTDFGEAGCRPLVGEVWQELRGVSTERSQPGAMLWFHTDPKYSVGHETPSGHYANHPGGTFCRKVRRFAESGGDVALILFVGVCRAEHSLKSIIYRQYVFSSCLRVVSIKLIVKDADMIFCKVCRRTSRV